MTSSMYSDFGSSVVAVERIVVFIYVSRSVSYRALNLRRAAIAIVINGGSFAISTISTPIPTPTPLSTAADDAPLPLRRPLRALAPLGLP